MLLVRVGFFLLVAAPVRAVERCGGVKKQGTRCDWVGGGAATREGASNSAARQKGHVGGGVRCAVVRVVLGYQKGTATLCVTAVE